ncbi:plasmid partitioning/stability family protein [Erwinia amylovora]
MTDNRKCSFYIYPDRNAADRVADGLLEKLPQKERGRAMRAMMLCGAALMKQDERLPFLIAEFMTDRTSMQDIQRIISSTLPQQEQDDINRLAELLRQATGGNASAVQLLQLQPGSGGVAAETPAKDSNGEETRRNSQNMFPDND